MLTIRRAQLEALQRSRNRALAARLSLSFHPVEGVVHYDEKMLDRLTDLVGEAQACGFKLDQNISAFLELGLLMGEKFFQQSICRWIIASSQNEDIKIVHLINHAERYALLDRAETDA